MLCVDESDIELEDECISEARNDGARDTRRLAQFHHRKCHGFIVAYLQLSLYLYNSLRKFRSGRD